MYHITLFERIKRITIPTDVFHLLFVSVDNEPLKKTKTKRYRHLIEIDKILSIVDFIKSKN